MTPAPQTSTPGLPALAALAAVVGFAALQLWAFSLAGVFEYPLDDVYIHLAMASGIAGGTYGVTPGEAASASSSILYPLLLLPFSGTEAQRLLPLIWNLAAVLGLGWLWGRVLRAAGLRGAAGVGFAVLGPLALNIPGVGFTGMENSLHALAALGAVLGLWRVLNGAEVAPWLVAALVLAPLLRLEGLALSGLVVLALIGAGRRTAGVAIGVAVLVPVAGFAAYLAALGLAPVPGSVLAKVGLAQAGTTGAARMLAPLWANLQSPAGQLLAVLTLLCAGLPLLLADLRRGPAAMLLAVLALAGVAHLLAGQIGWMHRYEHYIIIAQVAGLALAGGALTGLRARRWHVMLTLALVVAAAAFWPKLALNYIWNPRAIHLQQAQMARFVQDWLKAPVAVNDLGRVAWANPQPVLDLYGLASPEALALRQVPGGPPTGWAAALAEARGVAMALIYDPWFGQAVGPHWRRLALLGMDNPRGTLGGWEVAFYATDPALATGQMALLRDFAETLPAAARLTFEEDAP